MAGIASGEVNRETMTPKSYIESRRHPRFLRIYWVLAAIILVLPGCSLIPERDTESDATASASESATMEISAGEPSPAEATPGSLAGTPGGVDEDGQAAGTVELQAPTTTPFASADRPSIYTATVYATLTWQHTAVQVQQGDRLTLRVVDGAWTSRTGMVSPNQGEGWGYICNMAMSPLRCTEPLPDFPRGALIGKIGEQVFGIGNQAIIPAEDAGVLQLRINEGEDALKDNEGSLDVEIGVETR